MQTQFQYITEQAKQYRQFSEQQTALFNAINELPQNIVEIYTKNMETVCA